MTIEEYESLSWPVRVKLARLSLPKATKVALANDMQTSIRTVINWELGKTIPRDIYKDRIKNLCLMGVSPGGAGIGIDFMLGGFDANEKVLTKPLLVRDKNSTTIAMMAIACKIASSIYSNIVKTPVVISMDTVFNTYPSYINILINPINFNGVSYTIRITHRPADINYIIELYSNHGSQLNRLISNVSDSGIHDVVRLLKKSINKLKINK